MTMTTTETTYPTWQAIMDVAYNDWQQNTPAKSYDDFIYDLGGDQRTAVLLGNLNYQVENGGFTQWLFNGYADHADDVRIALGRIGTITASNVENLVLIALAAKREYDRHSDHDDDDGLGLDAQDTAYYAMRDQFMADVEAYFAGRST